MRSPRPMTNAGSRRRGVTLLEMLVTVALLLLMMVTIVAIFQAATGAVSVSRAYTLLDQDLRRLNTTIRQDLEGVTCKMTPPNNPTENRGYFEYSENALSDAQDEDSDDTLRFTAKAPDGRPFTGRMWVPKSVPPTDPGYTTTRSVTLEPVPVTSQYAEIIYFQRGDKLYRRVRLILPEFTSQAVGNQSTDPNVGGGMTRPLNRDRFGFATNLFEPAILFPAAMRTTFAGNVVSFVSWQGLNDISARPSSFKVKIIPGPQLTGDYIPVMNSLGDLTDRHNRYASPRFANDFRNKNFAPTDNSLAANTPDGLPDDLNGPDLDMDGRPDGDGVPDYYPTMYFNSKATPGGIPALLNDNFGGTGPPNTARPLNGDRTAFPYLFRNAYSRGIQEVDGAGTIHALDPDPTSRFNQTFNHNPLPVGDSLLTPIGVQTWWGFPTWRETMAPTWLDPIKRINDPAGSTFFGDAAAMALNEQPNQQFKGLSFMQSPAYALPPQPDQPFGETSAPANNWFDVGNAPVFEDDLIATNVRSFNVKAFVPNPRYFNSTSGTIISLLPGYFDLGYIAGINPATGAYDDRYASGSMLAPTISATSPYFLDTLGHEGRIPPLVADNRDDAQYPGLRINPSNSQNLGLGDNNATVVRMRRIWDSWSTTYSVAPALPIDPTAGPLNGVQAAIPSYPAPYNVPLRGIEIQIRLTDPDSKHVKTLTIRQDFSDKL